MALHHRKELEDGKAEWGHKERDTLQSFLSVRKNIIQKHLPQLGTQEVEVLAS